jgi:hypothetical protein
VKAVPMLAEIVAYEDLKVGAWWMRLIVEALVMLACLMAAQPLLVCCRNINARAWCICACTSHPWWRACDRRRCCRGCAGCA